MKLIRGEERFVVECHTDDFGYIRDDEYIFSSKEEMEKFLGIYNDYDNHVYYNGVDVFGCERNLGYNEYPKRIYSKIEYEIEWN